MKKGISIFIGLIMLISLIGCGNSNSDKTSSKEYKIQFKDDSGREIKMMEPAKRIISLYSAHTENLCELGADDEIIGRGTSDVYPPQIISKKTYSYKDDAEEILEAKPDVVLIRPSIEKRSPDFIKSLENAGINVIALYPKSFDEFDSYIEKLGLITGKEEKAKELLKNFNEELLKIKNDSSKIKNKVNVYFESTETNYRTVTPDSNPAKAIELAGGINIAKDAKALNKSTSIADYGAEKILAKAKEIDVFVSQKGAMNAGGSLHSVAIRSGFDKIKAVSNGRIYTIDEKLISSPVFRHIKGIRELQRMFYPEIFDDISQFKSDKPVTREELAKIVVMAKHKKIFTPTSKTYKKEKGHVYGSFKDVDINSPYFDYIETSVLSGYIECSEDKFNPKGKVTREEMAQIVYMLKDFPLGKANIKDINECSNAKIVTDIVGNNIMTLKDGKFNPKQVVTQKEAAQILKKTTI